METVICFICSSRTSDFHQNFNELHTTHSKAGLTVLLRRILKDSLMQRNIHFHLNCICTNCFDDINDYDRMCVEVLEKESKLRDRLLVTDAAIFSEQIKTKSKRNASNEPEMEIFTIELDDDSDLDDQHTTTAEMLQATLPEQNSCRTLDNLIKRVLDDRLQTEKNCTKCPKRFSSNEKFKRHMKWHKRVCEVCGNVFRNSDQLKVHMEWHTKYPGITCRFCFHKLKDRKSFQKHLAAHKKVPIGQCVHCDKVFDHMVQLRKHMLAHE